MPFRLSDAPAHGLLVSAYFSPQTIQHGVQCLPNQTPASLFSGREGGEKKESQGSVTETRVAPRRASRPLPKQRSIDLALHLKKECAFAVRHVGIVLRGRWAQSSIYVWIPPKRNLLDPWACPPAPSFSIVSHVSSCLCTILARWACVGSYVFRRLVTRP